MRRMRGLTSLPRELIVGEDSSPSPHETMAEMGGKGGRSAAAETVARRAIAGAEGEEEDDSSQPTP
jgi:hypothetical protein